MPITMMLVMTAIFETFVRSWSPLSKAVRALGRLWVDTRSAYQGNLTPLVAIKMGKNLSKLMLESGLPGLGLRISHCSFSRSRLIVCFRAFLTSGWEWGSLPQPILGNLFPIPHLMIPEGWFHLVGICLHIFFSFCQLKNHQQSKNHWHSSYCTSSL